MHTVRNRKASSPPARHGKADVPRGKHAQAVPPPPPFLLKPALPPTAAPRFPDDIIILRRGQRVAARQSPAALAPAQPATPGEGAARKATATPPRRKKNSANKAGHKAGKRKSRKMNDTKTPALTMAQSVEMADRPVGLRHDAPAHANLPPASAATTTAPAVAASAGAAPGTTPLPNPTPCLPAGLSLVPPATEATAAAHPSPRAVASPSMLAGAGLGGQGKLGGQGNAPLPRSAAMVPWRKNGFLHAVRFWLRDQQRRMLGGLFARKEKGTPRPPIGPSARPAMAAATAPVTARPLTSVAPSRMPHATPQPAPRLTELEALRLENAKLRERLDWLTARAMANP